MRTFMHRLDLTNAELFWLCYNTIGSSGLSFSTACITQKDYDEARITICKKITALKDQHLLGTKSKPDASSIMDAIRTISGRS